MRKRISIAIVAIAAAVAVPAVVVAASQAYTSPTLKVTYAGSATIVSASAGVSDDATARAAIYIPAGTPVTFNARTPGQQIGTVKAQVSALALGGALLPLTGPIIVAPPGAVPAATQAACTQGEPTSEIWLMQLSAAGQTLPVPVFVVSNTGPDQAIGPAKMVICLPPPDIPVDKGGATFGAKFLSAELTLNGVFGAVQTGAWVALWTPWQAGTGQINAAGTVASPAAIAPGSVTLKGKKSAGKRVLSGVVSQGGVGFANKVVLWGAVNKAAFKRIGVVTSKANGAFTYTVPKASKATTFQAKTSAAGRSAPPLCAALATLPVPCVNPTVNGFTAQSKAVALKQLSVVCQARVTWAWHASPVAATVRIGTCSWADDGLLRCWYPRGISTAEKRLRYYAERFDTVEVDSPFYALPDPEVTARWAQRTPDGFTFHVKAGAAMTWHEGEPTDEAFDAFRASVEPLELSGKLRGVLLQYHPRFTKTPEALEELARAPERLAPLVPLVEFRHRSWMEEDERADTLAYLERHGLAYVSVDSPRTRASNVSPRVAAATHRVVYVRFHGRNTLTWNIRGGTAADRFDWLYSPEELEEWVGPLQRLAGEAEEVYALFNNNRDDFAPRGAATLRALLDQAGVPASGGVEPPTTELTLF